MYFEKNPMLEPCDILKEDKLLEGICSKCGGFLKVEEWEYGTEDVCIN